MSSPFYRPTNPFVSPQSAAAPSAFSGSKELSYAGLAAGIEGGDGALGTHQVAQQAAMKASTEAIALAKSMSLAHGTIGNAALMHPIGQAAAAAAASEVSPLVQLIMKLPGALGLTSSFFEWLQHLFAPGAHDLLGGLEGALHLDIAGHAAALEHVSSLAQVSEHFTIGMHSLPTDAPILHGLKDASVKASDGLLSGAPGDHFVQDPANIGAGADLNNAQFEHGMPPSDGALAGPSLTQPGGHMVLSGNQRLFSDNMSSGNFASMVSNTSTPAAAPPSASLLSNQTQSMAASSPPYQAAEAPAQMPASSLLSGKACDSGLLSGASGNQTGSLLSGTRPDTMTSGQTGSLLSGKGETLLASDVPSYNPSSGGVFQGSAAPSEPEIAPLKAKPLSFADLHKGASGSHGHVETVPERGVIDHVGHQSNNHVGSPAHASSQDAASNHNLAHHQYLAAKPSAEELMSPSASHPVPNVAHEVHRALPVRSTHSQFHLAHKGPVKFSKTLSDALRHQDQLKVSGLAGKASQYAVQHGDSLWGIAQNKLGSGMHWHDLYHLNSDVLGSNPNMIFSGTQLKLPDMASQLGKYVVKPGDSLWTIAKNQLGDGSRWTEIYKANASIIGESPRLIVPGQQLSMPAANPAVAQAAPANAAAVAAAPHAPEATALNGAAAANMPVHEQVLHAHAAGSDAAVSSASGGSASQFNMQSGPGAAAAATLHHQSGALVSSKLAPDLSFLRKPD
jgi:nucleoid-associated protein YgaU